MLPADIRLYTWLDVEEVFLRLAPSDWPDWLISVQAYWDSLTLAIRPRTHEEANQWLRDIFDPRFDSQAQGLVLESPKESRRLLPTYLEVTEEAPPQPRFVPTLSRPGVLSRPDTSTQALPVFDATSPPVVVFHSFKGGVGRTLHLLALACFLTSRQQRVLLVDGDLEAPGISWLISSRLPLPPIAFADVLALAHGDTTSSKADTITLVVERLQHARIDGHFILPAFRSLERFTSLDIRPEHLMQSDQDPFILTRLLGDIGKALGVAAVLVDLRAGLSELATGLLLDPRVYRVLVTTLSGQALDGTCKLLDLLGRRAPSQRDEDPRPALLLTQVPEELKQSHVYADAERRLLEASGPFLSDDPGEEPLQGVTAFEASLLALPNTWEDVLGRLQRSSLVAAMRPLADWLPVRPAPGDKRSPGTLENLQAQRQTLKDVAGKLEYAEKGEGKEFLVTASLRRLASDHRQQVPITVIIGAKGAGKTYTFLQIVQRRQWKDFVNDTRLPDIDIEAPICPLLESKNLISPVQQLVQNVRGNTASCLALQSSVSTSALRDHIRDGLQQSLHEGQWRERWLDVMAWGGGFAQGQPGTGREFVAHLAAKQQRLVMVIDGLEDLFQNLATAQEEQTALRALVQEVPEWLEQQPERPMGLLVFVRRDMVMDAVRQNAAQLMHRYEPYALQWSRAEVLRLAAWVAKKANLLPTLPEEALQEQEEDELTEALVPLWGRKLGSERSREGRSAAWVLAVLSDFKGQIQARDLIRFLHLAAARSLEDTFWYDRVLVPKAMREVLEECSRKKIEEIITENLILKDIFSTLQDLSSEQKHIPFTQSESNLSPEEMKILEDNGALLREGNHYYLPEIFRSGLGFSRSSVARPRILALARRATR
jgi:MinD-like ATPase involved in chromosome partitioning or flagellar assembly